MEASVSSRITTPLVTVLLDSQANIARLTSTNVTATLVSTTVSALIILKATHASVLQVTLDFSVRLKRASVTKEATHVLREQCARIFQEDRQPNVSVELDTKEHLVM